MSGKFPPGWYFPAIEIAKNLFFQQMINCFQASLH